MEEIKPIKEPGMIRRFLAWSFRKLFSERSWIGKTISTLFLVWLVFFMCGERIILADLLLAIRKYFLVFLVFSLVLWWIFRVVKKTIMKFQKIGVIVTVILVGLIVTACIKWKFNPLTYVYHGIEGSYDYVSGYIRYQNTKVVYIQSLPETGHEIVQPRISVLTKAGQTIQETEKISDPYLVRVDSNSYHWVMSLQPSTFNKRLVGKVETIYNLSAEKSALNFVGNHQSEVSFLIGENLYLGAEVKTATMRKLSLLDLFMMEAGEPRFLKNDDGEWVQVVPLIRWVGFFFPRPEFGGVNVIQQEHETGGPWGHLVAMTKRFMFGAGTIYTPKQMEKFAYLQNQNLMPKEVSLSIAKSFRFQSSFWGPMGINHVGDIRIPISDSTGQDNGIDEQPTTMFFKMSQVNPNAPDMLYDYFGLPPYDDKKDGLVVSLFIPSDGSGKVLVYKHSSKKEGTLASTAVPSTIRSAKLNNYWTNNKVTGIRPYNIKINGVVRSFWKASIVTRSQHANGWISPDNAQIAIVDLQSSYVTWVDPKHPELWANQVQKESGYLGD